MKIKALSAAVAAALALPQAAMAIAPTDLFDAVIHFAGATAEDNLMKNSIVTDICATNINYLNKGNEWGIFCTVQTGAAIPASISGKYIQILKHGSGGSDTGVASLVSNSPLAYIDPTTCGAAPATTVTIGGVVYPSWTCTGTVLQTADWGVSDVNPEMFQGINQGTGFGGVNASISASVFGSANQSVVGQVFGIAVSNDLWNALQSAQITQGLLPGCVAGSTTEACTPNLTKEMAASLYTGKVNNWANLNINGTSLTTLVAAPATTAVKVCRRVAGSGTQATINNVVLDSPCNSGGLAPLTLGNAIQGAGSGDVEKCLTAWNAPASAQTITGNGGAAVTVNAALQTGWAVGMMALDRATSPAWKFVKYEGVYPSVANVHAGKYHMWSEATIQYPIVGAPAPAVSPIGAPKDVADYLKTTISTKAAVISVNNALAIAGTPAYVALPHRNVGVAIDAVYNPATPNPLIGWTHTSTTNTDNCRVPTWFSATVPAPMNP